MAKLINRTDVASVIVKFENGDEALIENPTGAVFTCENNWRTKGKGSPIVTDEWLEYKIYWTEREGELERGNDRLLETK